MNNKMLLTFTELISKDPIAINPTKVVSVFTVKADGNTETPYGEFVGKTMIVLINSNLLVEESYDEVVGRINGELNNMITFYDAQRRIFTANV
jgi:hypothetical protein